MEVDGNLIAEIASATGKGVRVLVIDSGVETSHPEIAGRKINTWKAEKKTDDVTIEPDDEGDVFGHGTAVSAIIGKYAPQCQIDSVRALGGDLFATSQHILASLSWGLEQKYDVINCSFGSGNVKFLPNYYELVNRAFCCNSILVSASNNLDYMYIEYPGSFPSVISTDFALLEALTLQRRPGKLVEFIACGDQVRCAWKGGEYRTNSGSSFAAPHITALVAKIRQLRPKWNANQIKSILYDIATETD